MAEVLGSKRSARSPQPEKRPIGRLVGWLILPSLVVGAGALLLEHWQLPTRIELLVRTDEVTFEVGGEAPTVLFDDGLELVGLATQSFDEIELIDASLASEAREISITPQKGWAVARAEIFAAGDASAPIVLEGITLPAGVTLTIVRSSDSLRLRIDGAQAEARLLLRNPVSLRAENCSVTVEGRTLPEEDFYELPIQPSKQRPVWALRGRRDRLSLSLDLSSRRTDQESAHRIPVTELRFDRLGGDGERVSSVEEGMLRLLARNDRWSLERGEWVVLDPASGFGLDSIVITRREGLRLLASGPVTSIESGRDDRLERRNETALDRVTENRLVGLLTAVALWVFPTTLAGFRLIRGLQRGKE